MGRSLLFWALMCAVLLVAATSRSDVATSSTQATVPSLPAPTEAVAEPTIDSPAVSEPGSETPPRDPFSPYDIGPAPDDKSRKPFWSYQDLNAEEKRVADRGRDVTGWDATHDAFSKAVALRAHQAAADSAAHQLGVDSLASTGVVP